MANTYWRPNRSGDWTTGADWSSGVPGANDDAFIRGTNFTVDLTTEQAVANLTLSGQGVVLEESATGALDMANGGTLSIANGATFDVGAENAGFDATTLVSNATISFADGASLGGEIVLDHSTLAVTGGDLELSQIVVTDSSFSLVPTGLVEVASDASLLIGELDLDGSVRIGDADHQGTVYLVQVSSMSGTLEVGGGTLTFLSGQSYGLINTTLQIDAGATLDLDGASVAVSYLTNNGTITNTGGQPGELIIFPLVYPSLNVGTVTGSVVIEPADAPNSFPTSTTIDGTFNLSRGGGFSVESSILIVDGSVTIAKTGGIGITSDGMNFGGYLDLEGSFSIAGRTYLDDSSGLVLAGAGTISGKILGDGTASIDVESAGKVTLSGGVEGAYLYMDGAGTLALTKAGSLEKLQQTAGTTLISKTAALGSATLELDGGVLISKASGALSGAITLNGAGAIAAATGKTLDLTGTLANTTPGHSLTIGSASAKGAVLFDLSVDQNSSSAGDQALIVADGTLRIGAAGGGQSGLAQFDTVDVESGAKLDLHGQSVLIDGLAGAGMVTNAGSVSTMLQLAGGDFDGAITGASLGLDITVDPNSDASPITVLTHAETYGGGTSIESGATLVLAGNASIEGSISLYGTLQIDEAGSVTLSNILAGPGELDQIGSGTTTVTTTNVFADGVTQVENGRLVIASGATIRGDEVTVSGGVLELQGSGSAGADTIHLAGGELLVDVNSTIGGTLDLVGGSSSTIAVAHGATVTINSDVTNGGAAVSFGDGQNDGTILFAPNSVTPTDGLTLYVEGGTVELGNAAAAAALEGSGFVGIYGNGTLDLDGQAVTTGNFHQYGTLTDSGPAATFTLESGQNLSYGTISGAISIIAETDATFNGTGSFTGLTLAGAVDVTIGGAAAEKILFTGMGETLTILGGAAVTGRIGGFASGDALDLQAIGYGSSTKLTYNANTHVLKVTDGTNSVSLTVAGSFTAANFSLADDGTGHTRVSLGSSATQPGAFANAATAFASGHEAALVLGLEHALHLVPIAHDMHLIA